MSRRSYGEGSIREIKRGERTVWLAQISGGVDVFGRRVRISRTCSSERAAKRALSELEAKLRAGTPARPTKSVTLAEYLTAWIDGLRANQTVRESTRNLYEQLLASHAIPIAGRVPLTKFDAARALALYDELDRTGRSSSIRKKVHSVLSVALGDAVPRLIPYNPVSSLPRRARPKYSPAKRSPYEPTEIRAFLAAVAGDRYEALYVLALFSQLREGELFGLERKNVADDYQSIYVAAAKTNSGVRRVDLPAIAALALERHLSPIALLRRKASGSPLVFPGARGKQLIGRNFLRRELYPAMERAKVRRITFHDFRHSGAMLIAHMVPLTVLRERLGHRSTSTSLIYAGHRSPGNQAAAVIAFDAIVAKWQADGKRPDSPGEDETPESLQDGGLRRADARD